MGPAARVMSWEAVKKEIVIKCFFSKVGYLDLISIGVRLLSLIHVQTDEYRYIFMHILDIYFLHTHFDIDI